MKDLDYLEQIGAQITVVIYLKRHIYATSRSGGLNRVKERTNDLNILDFTGHL